MTAADWEREHDDAVIRREMARAEKAEARVAAIRDYANRLVARPSLTEQGEGRTLLSILDPDGTAYVAGLEEMAKPIAFPAPPSMTWNDSPATPSVRVAESHKTITTISKDDENMSQKHDVETIAGHKTPGINPGVRVRLIAAPACTGIVDGWMSDTLVRVTWDTGTRGEVAAIALEIVPETAGVRVPTSDLEAVWSRFRSHTATVEDLLLLAVEETQHAIEALPPHAVALQADPYHASACALRANTMIKLALRKRADVAIIGETKGKDPSPLGEDDCG